ncbi:MAG: putative sulfate exporter family transporter [Planctomycetota bacterium]|nr:MAG: putative sulfate exporter family transporter [Planctomycetota bacterium]
MKGEKNKNTNSWKGIGLSIALGGMAYGIKQVSQLPFLDTLVLAMLFGIILKAILGTENFPGELNAASRILIPFGIVFYAMKNANVAKWHNIGGQEILLVSLTMGTYFCIVFFLGKRFKLSKESIALLATGSAICGASAIAITAPAVKAKSKDVSLALLATTLAAFVGVYLFFPFFAILLQMDNSLYASLAGAVVQFTGFVKVAVYNVPTLPQTIPSQDTLDLALNLKGIRYFGLLLAIPLFGSWIKSKSHFLLVLGLFLAGSVLGSTLSLWTPTFHQNTLQPILKPLYSFSWAIALASIGLSVDIKEVFNSEGLHGLLIAFVGFLTATFVFLTAAYLFRLLL